MLDLLREYGIAPVLPGIAGSYKGGNVVICGDGECLWRDLETFGCRDEGDGGKVAKPGWDFMCVNMAGSKFPGVVEHWYSNAGYLVERFLSVRRQEYPRSFSVNHLHALDGFTQEWPSAHVWPWTGHGTSGCGACLTAMALGYDRAVLCGIPLDNRPHNGEPPWRKTNFVNEVRGDRKHWLNLARHFAGRITSMSGQTRKWFGDPFDCDCASESACRMLDRGCQNTHLAVRERHPQFEDR